MPGSEVELGKKELRNKEKCDKGSWVPANQSGQGREKGGAKPRNRWSMASQGVVGGKKIGGATFRSQKFYQEPKKILRKLVQSGNRTPLEKEKRLKFEAKDVGKRKVANQEGVKELTSVKK